MPFINHVTMPPKKTPDAYKYDTSGKSLWTRFVQKLNAWLNPNHAWYDYSTWKDADQGTLDNWLAGSSGSGLTVAQRATNAFNAEEAEKQRMWEEHMSNTAYQRQVKDMQAAGVNPAMAMNGSGGASTPSGSSATSSSPAVSGMPFDLIMQAIMLPLQKKLLAAQAQNQRDQGEAALINAHANAAGVPIREGELGVKKGELRVHEYEAETRRMLKDIEERKTGIYERLTEDQRRELAERAAYIQVQREQLPETLKIAWKNADSDSKRAIAALQQAQASVQNAATNDRLADYETSLKYAQELMVWSEKDGRDIVNKYLDESERTRIDNMLKEGVRIDKQGRLYDKTGRYLDSQMVRNYVESACSVSNAVNKWVNPLAGMDVPSMPDWFASNSVSPGAGVLMYGGM